MPALTTRGLKENHIELNVNWIDTMIADIDNEEKIKKVKNEINEFMSGYDLYKNWTV